MLELKDIHSSHSEQLDYEYNRCKNDPFYFKENYYDVLHFNETIKPGIDEFQERVYDAIIANPLTCIEGGENTTKTTLVSAYAVWTCLFNSNKRVLYVTMDQTDRSDVMDHIISSINMMPMFLFNQLPRLTVSHPRDLLFGHNGSKLEVRESCDVNDPCLCGTEYDLVILDDHAYYDDSFRCDNVVNMMAKKYTNMRVIAISTTNPTRRNAFDENMKILQRSFVPVKLGL